MMRGKTMNSYKKIIEEWTREHRFYLLGKVCTTTVATRVSVPDFRWRYHTCFSKRLKVDFAPFVGPLAVCRRTHARNPCSSVRRTIQRLDRANKVCSCAVFLASPR